MAKIEYLLFFVPDLSDSRMTVTASVMLSSWWSNEASGEVVK
jgi:hypothetical protein